jgi:hypothetical protein
MKNTIQLLIFVVITSITSCSSKNPNKTISVNDKVSLIETYTVKDNINTTTISDKGFSGKYVGLEFDKNGDIAHQFSNKVTKIIGKYLKDSYSRGVYLKVDFKNTKIITTGLNLKGYVEFVIDMPFIKVKKRDAFTGLVHCGTWVNQKSSILDVRVKTQLRNLKTICVGNTDQGYFKTSEGYKEYWIQFKHKKYQKNCH